MRNRMHLLHEPDIVDVEAREVRPQPAGADARAERAAADDVSLEVPFEAPLDSPAPARTIPESFTLHQLPIGGHRYRYRLYKPAASEAAGGRPMVVMLHGCKQDSEDFARGTAMNEVAAREGFLVLYPEQLRRSNSMGCWNWFEPAHQQRDAGEPAAIAAMVRQVIATHAVDPRRVYVAGLSAGGAMAALMGELYPELFAAVGVHSGLAPHAASDVTSAFRAMRNGAKASALVTASSAQPTIVFHSVDDKTVAARNGDTVLSRQIAAHEASGTLLEPRQAPAGEPGSGARDVARTSWVDAAGTVRLEKWSVMGAPHAWSGGHASGSFTDPSGPNASQAMARFFLKHAR